MLSSFIKFANNGRDCRNELRYKDTSLREKRDEALFEAYTRALREGNFASQREAIRYVCRGPAPRFYINGDFCATLIGRLLKSQPTQLKGTLREKRSADLFRLYCEEKAKPGNENLPKQRIANRIVEMPAPEFYINERVATSIIIRQREKKLKQLGRCIR